MKRRLFTLAAVGAVILAGAVSNAQAATKLVGNTVVAPRVVGPANGNPGGEGIYITSTTIGDATPGAPCYFCGPANSIAIPYPLVALPGGTSYYLTVQLQSVSYTGVPTVNITMTEGGQVIATGSVTFSSEFAPGYVGYAYFTGTLPTTTGVVTVSSSISTRSGQQIAPGGAKFSIY